MLVSFESEQCLGKPSVPNFLCLQWDAKLIIFTSKNIVITGLSLVGVCGLVSIIIVLLHMRERRLDHQAKLQEAHRFHFDAM